MGGGVVSWDTKSAWRREISQVSLHWVEMPLEEKCPRSAEVGAEGSGLLSGKHCPPVSVLAIHHLAIRYFHNTKDHLSMCLKRDLYDRQPIFTSSLIGKPSSDHHALPKINIKLNIFFFFFSFRLSSWGLFVGSISCKILGTLRSLQVLVIIPSNAIAQKSMHLLFL